MLMQNQALAHSCPCPIPFSHSKDISSTASWLVRTHKGMGGAEQRGFSISRKDEWELCAHHTGHYHHFISVSSEISHLHRKDRAGISQGNLIASYSTFETMLQLWACGLGNFSRLSIGYMLPHCTMGNSPYELQLMHQEKSVGMPGVEKETRDQDSKGKSFCFWTRCTPRNPNDVSRVLPSLESNPGFWC